MYSHPYRIKGCAFASFVFIIALLLGCLVPCFADKTVTIVIAAGDADADEAETDVRVGQLQDWLEKLGYYEGEYTMILDADTQYALYSFCQRNDLDYTDAGVTQEAWDLLESGEGLAAADDAAAYEDIAFGTEGENVLELQTRLKELGYYSGDISLNPSVYDDGTQQAIDLFCETNSISYEGDGIPASVQYILFSDGALEYAAPEVKQTLSEKISAYMTQSVDVFGALLPMYFVWICSVIIVVLILLLSVYFFVPDRDKAASKNAAPQGVPQYWRRTVTGMTGAGLDDVEKLSNSGNLLDFQINYNGGVSNIQCACKPMITIGRSGCSITLDASDRAVSNSHCDLYYRGAVLMIRDHSSNGTYVNGRLIHKSECRINSNDRIAIGAHLLVIQF